MHINHQILKFTFKIYQQKTSNILLLYSVITLRGTPRYDQGRGSPSLIGIHLEIFKLIKNGDSEAARGSRLRAVSRRFVVLFVSTEPLGFDL